MKKGTTEDEMTGWHHRLDGHGFGWTPGVGDRQGGLACCDSWGLKVSDTTERLNCTDWKGQKGLSEGLQMFLDLGAGSLGKFKELLLYHKYVCFSICILHCNVLKEKIKSSFSRSSHHCGWGSKGSLHVFSYSCNVNLQLFQD